MKTFIVVPAFNEGANVSKLLRDIQSLASTLSLSVIFVNDGSTDDTLSQASRFTHCMDLEIIDHPTNQGISKTFYDGLDAAATRAHGTDCILMIEGDNTSDLSLLPQMARHVARGVDLVIASRYISGGGYVNFPIFRTIGSYLINSGLKILIRIPGLSDYTIFFRAYRAEVVQKALAEFGTSLLTLRSFAANLELLLKMQKYTQVVAEVPLRYDYGLKKGSSKMNIRKTLVDYRDLILRRMASWV